MLHYYSGGKPQLQNLLDRSTYRILHNLIVGS
ncbi:hypothetical protein Mal65_15960 [Crateriforma conspicua]|nr:hypothetical protein Mal65_15960 [Crateriforma conspicua]